MLQLWKQPSSVTSKGYLIINCALALGYVLYDPIVGKEFPGAGVAGAGEDGEALMGVFFDGEVAKIRLVPLRKVGHMRISVWINTCI